jgi:hypothetical protein
LGDIAQLRFLAPAREEAMGRSEDPLLQAERHVREGEIRVARQTALIERLIARQLDPAGAEVVLEGLRTALALACERLQLERAKRQPPSGGRP